MNKSIKRYLIDYSFSVTYAICFYTPLGVLLWQWSINQTVSYILTTFIIAMISGRLYGGLLNMWRGLFGERRQ